MSISLSSFPPLSSDLNSRFTGVIEDSASSAFEKDGYFKVPELVIAAIELGFKIEFIVGVLHKTLNHLVYFVKQRKKRDTMAPLVACLRADRI